MDQDNHAQLPLERDMPDHRCIQMHMFSLVSLLEVTGVLPRHPRPGRDRPIQPWSTETGAELGSSRPLLREPEQLPGAMQPVSGKAGPIRRCDVCHAAFCW